MLLSATKISQSNHSLVSQNRVLDKTEEMKAQQTMTDTNRFKGTSLPLFSRLLAWVARVVACTLPKRL
jgi:hypothetical protein